MLPLLFLTLFSTSVSSSHNNRPSSAIRFRLSRGVAAERLVLKQADAPFKLTLFADLHFGENAWMNWGPLQDVKFIQVMNSVLDSETPCENGFRKRSADVSECVLASEARSKKDLAWHDVAMCRNFRYSRAGELEVLVRYVGFGKVEDEWVNVKNEMRERSIPLEPSECPKVKDGDLVLCFLERGDYGLYFDARVVRIQRRLHDATDCKCIFTVRFLHDNSEEEIHWKGVCYRPTQGNSTQEKHVVFHNSPKPTQEKSNVAHNSPGPTIEPSLSDIENLWP
ncbi:protein SAWADEE HOMEODOMAIN HOMOLOG 2-like [Lotus japonicus]|uniref:protein SAWADEE HOMEODOMAIN HOMOLOG 2-like n=1 Tax=Lotus japonicus TaxID=34305 RepID=UPI00258759D3|nr:protein SAWADEE HOMEODOMAIN HOMOLOG 2-like [Lotus japonicus]